MKRTNELQGRRLPDQPRHGVIHAQPGDFWRWVNDDGTPLIFDPWPPTNLTGGYWGGITPNGLMMNLLSHTVRETADGMITVAPGDGSSNSILCRGHLKPEGWAPGDGAWPEAEWHGYITDGLWWSLA